MRLLLLLLLLAAPAARAGELFCTVDVNTQQLNRQDVQFLQDMGRSLERYVNERTWTEDVFRPEERIECDMRVVFLPSQGLGQTRFKANFGLTTRRPVYGTIQKVTVLQVLDADWEFEYVPGTQFSYDGTRYDEVLSLVNFYVYLALGYDYDTFAELGGTRHFESAREIANIASSSNGIGWSAFGTDRTRLRLITQLLDPRIVPLRKASYAVHFGALDRFLDAPDTARTVAVGALRDVKGVFDEMTKLYALDIFLLTRASELVSMLERSEHASAAYGLLVAMDPARQSDYNRLIN